MGHASPSFVGRADFDGLGQAGFTLATVTGQESDELIHRRIVGRIVDEAAFPLTPDKPNPGQMREMERGRSGLNTELLSDGAGVDARWPRFDQQAKDGKS